MEDNLDGAGVTTKLGILLGEMDGRIIGFAVGGAEAVEVLRNNKSGIVQQDLTSELIKLEGTIRKKMEDVKQQRVSLRDSGLGGLMNTLKKVDEALYEKILPEYKKMVADFNIFK